MMRNDPWEIIVQPTKAIPVDVLNYILTLLRETFVEEVDDTLWSDVDWHILIMIEGKLVSHVEIVEREACVDQDVVKLGGIGGVITLPEWRGRGLARAGMRKAQEFMCEELGVEFGLLMCARAMVTYYSKRGWVDVEGP